MWREKIKLWLIGLTLLRNPPPIIASYTAQIPRYPYHTSPYTLHTSLNLSDSCGESWQTAHPVDPYGMHLRFQPTER